MWPRNFKLKLKRWTQKAATRFYLARLPKEARRAFLKQFDPKFYLDVNPDVRSADSDPLFHFLVFGWREGRNPNPTFDTNYYLANNADVAKARINPLSHYVLNGAAEGRAHVPRPRRGVRSVSADGP